MTIARNLTADVSVMSVADVLVWLANRERSGRLVIAQGVVSKMVDIERGHAVRVYSSSPREDLAQLLLNFGLTTQAALEAAHHLGGDSDIRLGRVLVLDKVVAEEDLRRVLEHQIRESVLDTVRWDIGRFEFLADARPNPKAEVSVAVPLHALHKLAGARAPHWAAFHQAFPRLDVRLQIVESAVAAHPDPVRDDILGLIRAGATIEAVLQQMLMIEYDLYARLYELMRSGVLHNVEAMVPPPSISPGEIAFDMIVEDPVEARPRATPRNIPYPPPIVPAFIGTAPLRSPLAADLVPPPVPGSAFQRAAPEPSPFATRTPPPAHASGAIPLTAPAARIPHWPTPPGGSIMTGGHHPGVMQQSGAASSGHGPVSTAQPEVPRTSRTPQPSQPSIPVVSGPVPAHRIPHLIGGLADALRLRTSPRERYLLRRIDGNRTVADILQMVPMSDAEMVDLLRGLMAAGIVHLP